MRVEDKIKCVLHHVMHKIGGLASRIGMWIEKLNYKFGNKVFWFGINTMEYWTDKSIDLFAEIDRR